MTRLLILAIFLISASASTIRFCDNNQRGDSGNALNRNLKLKDIVMAIYNTKNK